MDTDTTANPAGGEDTSLDTQAAETEAEAPEVQLDDDGNPIEEPEEPEDDSEEVDHDGQKYRVPKALKDAFLRQADYTRKTQELADQRKALEAEREAASQADEREMQARGNKAMLQMQIAQYQKVDWQRWTNDDPFAAQAAFQQFTLLKDALTETDRYLNHLGSERQSKQQQEVQAASAAYAKLLDEGTPDLKKEIPDWGRDKAAKLTDTTMRNYGFSREDLGIIDDPRLYRVMNDAAAWRDHQAKQKKAQSIQAQQQVTPAAKATRNTAPPGKLDDRQSTDAWMKQREAQVRQRA